MDQCVEENMKKMLRLDLGKDSAVVKEYYF